MSNQEIQLGDFLYKKEDDGQWTYKANKLKNKVLKPKYKDLPRYNVIYSIEGNWKQVFDQILSQTMKSVIKKVKEFGS